MQPEAEYEIIWIDNRLQSIILFFFNVGEEISSSGFGIEGLPKGRPERIGDQRQMHANGK
jgi:hypothetical protein